MQTLSITYKFLRKSSWLKLLNDDFSTKISDSFQYIPWDIGSIYMKIVFEINDRVLLKHPYKFKPIKWHIQE